MSPSLTKPYLYSIRFMKRNSWRTLFALIVLVVSVICFITLKPVRRIDSDILVSKNSIPFEEARIYYSILSSICTIIVGCLGLILGFIYFHGRKRFDAQNRKIDQLRGLLDRVIDKMDFINRQTLGLLSTYSDETTSKNTWIATEITSAFEEIELLLEHNCSFLCLSDEELLEIAKLRSTVEQDILLCDLSVLYEKEILVLKKRYVFRMRKAKMILYQKYNSIPQE